MGERVAEMLRTKRRKANARPNGSRNGRPVISERDCGCPGSHRSEVVAPGPTAEPEGTVARVVPRLPREGVLRVDHLDLVGHLVVPLWWFGWYMDRRKIWPHYRNGVLSTDPRTQPVPSIAARRSSPSER